MSSSENEIAIVSSSAASSSTGADAGGSGGGGNGNAGNPVHQGGARINVVPGGRGNQTVRLAQPLGVAPFQNGQYVRLLSLGRRRGRRGRRGGGGYLFADESGRGLSTGGNREMVNTVWRVQMLQTGAGAYHVVLAGAYGRHIAAAPRGASDGHVGYLATQGVFNTMEDTHVMWKTIPGSSGAAGEVVLLNENSATGVLRALRANGRYRRWNRGVTLKHIDRDNARFSLMMDWEVQVIPMRLHRPPFQPRQAARLPFQLGGAATCFGLRSQDSRQIQVGIRVADHNGNINVPAEEILLVTGRSLNGLGNAVVRQYGNGFSFQNMSIFIQAGNLGRPFPLLTDLPSGLDDFDVVVFMVGTPGYNQLRFPDIDAA